MAGESKPRTLSVKLEADVVESARIVTGYGTETMTELLSRLLRPALAKMEREMVAKRQEALEAAEKPTRKRGGRP